MLNRKREKRAPLYQRSRAPDAKSSFALTNKSKAPAIALKLAEHQ